MGKKKNSKPFWKRLNFKDERWIKVLGLFTLFFSILLLISMISYLFTWRFDQDKVLNFSWHIFFQKDLEVANTFGRLGAFLSHQVMYWSFGLPAFVLVYISLMYTWKWVRNAKYSLAMKTLSALWIMVYSSVLLESLLGRFAFPFGGAIGEWIAFYLRNMLGMVGLIGLLLLIVAVIFIWNFNPDFSGLRLPSYQLSGGESPSINMGSFLSFFKKNQSDQPSGTVSDETNGSNKKPIDMDFTDEVPDLRDDREPITLDQDHYKPQYADLKDLRKNEPVLEFEEININTPGTRTDAEALLDLEIHHLSEDPEMSLDPLSPNIEDLTLTEDHYANL